MCVLLEKNQVPSESWEEAPGLFILFSFSPCAQLGRKHEEKGTRGLPPEPAKIVEKNS